eukprot:3317388-Amphidinium_carterae.1
MAAIEIAVAQKTKLSAYGVDCTGETGTRPARSKARGANVEQRSRQPSTSSESPKSLRIYGLPSRMSSSSNPPGPTAYRVARLLPKNQRPWHERAWRRAMEADLAAVHTMNEEEMRAATNLSQPSNPSNDPDSFQELQAGSTRAARDPHSRHTIHHDVTVNRVWCSSCLKNRRRATEGWLTRSPCPRYYMNYSMADTCPSTATK